MNFKPTILKTAVSIIAGLIAGIYSSKVYYTYNGIDSTPISYVFGVSSIIGFLIPLISIYVIWSLIQKKK